MCVLYVLYVLGVLCTVYGVYCVCCVLCLCACSMYCVCVCCVLCVHEGMHRNICSCEFLGLATDYRVSYSQAALISRQLPIPHWFQHPTGSFMGGALLPVGITE